MRHLVSVGAERAIGDKLKPRPELIVGVDPGLACGFAVLDGDDFYSMDLTPEFACDELARQLQRGKDTVVAVEMYIPKGNTGKMTRQNDALEIIGVSRYLARTLGARAFLLQGTSDAQTACKPAVLRRMGWYAKGKDHCNKAAAQVGLALMKMAPLEYERRTR